jgi:glycosyltransferase involved in cell wall biosynthesis
MRIGILAPPWIPVPPPSYGGTESVVHTLAVGLAEAGHDVVLAASSDSTCPVQRVPRLEVSSSLSMDSGRQEILHVLRAYEAMGDVDIVHDHTLLGPLCQRAIPNVPRTTTLHGPFDDELTRIYGAMGRETSLVAISRHQASTARGVKIDAVIHHGLDVRNVRYSPVHNGGACFLGRMHPNKGLLQAIMVARQAEIPLRIGAKMRESCEKEYFHDVIEPLLGPDVEYLGELGTAEKYQLLGESVALLNPIQWPEPFGMVMIEALATGTPVVATCQGSAPEIISHGETGFLADSVQDLAEALQNCNQLRRYECRRAAEQRFSSQRMVGEYLQHYAGLLADSRRTSREATAAGF